jgi:hypothetical protein
MPLFGGKYFLHLQNALKPTTRIFISVKVSNLKTERVTELIVASRNENNSLSHLVDPVKWSVSHRSLHVANHAWMKCDNKFSFPIPGLLYAEFKDVQ